MRVRKLIIEKRIKILSANDDEDKAVSYTHLDVYKRQVIVTSECR